MRQEDYEFVERIACGSELPASTRAQDRVRQRCRKAGLVAYKNAKWRVTAKGYRALENRLNLETK